jgi:hypothetical protein
MFFKRCRHHGGRTILRDVTETSPGLMSSSTCQCMHTQPLAAKCRLSVAVRRAVVDAKGISRHLI